MLTVSPMPSGSAAGLHFNVLVPGGSLLFESARATANHNQYKGQFYKTGDHTVVVYSRGKAKASYELEIVIESMAATPAAKASAAPSRQEQACLGAVALPGLKRRGG